jgi:hypothetical protein
MESEGNVAIKDERKDWVAPAITDCDIAEMTKAGGSIISSDAGGYS